MVTASANRWMKKPGSDWWVVERTAPVSREKWTVLRKKNATRPDPPAYSPGLMRSIFRSLLILAHTPVCLAQSSDGEIFNTEKSTTTPLPAKQAALEWKLPPGFKATAFAEEPDVRQPIAMCLDDKGRLWVAESYMYAGHIGGYFEKKLRDRIVILEDTDRDGRHDKRTIFADNLERLTSLEVGLGGVWALTLPHLVFIPDKNRDDVPDGPAVPHVDGFDIVKSAHTLANGLKWGPDGWLYGRQGILAHSVIGVSGGADESRKKLNGGIWRYHPTRKTVEVVAEGTTNPWGTDWDEHGEMFFINTVIGHLWHVIPGAHYKRMFGDDYNPHIFGQIDQHADHVHWDTTEKWSEIREGMSESSSSAGGGHAHTGLMIYLGDNWPDEFRKDLFTINFHGRRLNREHLEPTGSGFVSKHRPDLAFSSDPWFRGIDLLYGPDGGVFVSDWSDTGECHDDDGIHRQSGRIYKIVFEKPNEPAVGDVAALSSEKLLPLLSHKNEWFSRRARLALQQRAADGENLDALVPALRKQLDEGATTALKLRALWALHAIGKTDNPFLIQLLSRPEPEVRIWAIRLSGESTSLESADKEMIAALVRISENENEASVRLALASVLQRLPIEERAGIASPLLKRAEDANDHNLPLMLWYGIEPLATSHRLRLADLAKQCAIPLVRKYIARRLAMDPADPERAFDQLILHASTAPEASTLDILGGLSESMAGVKSPAAPPSWPRLSKALGNSGNDELKAYHRSIGAMYRDPSAIEANLTIASDEKAAPETRAAAFRILTTIGEPRSLDLAKSLFGKPVIHPAAIERLAMENDPIIAGFFLSRLSALSAADQAPVIDALVSRAPSTAKLLDAIESGKLPATILSPFQVRQIRSHASEDLSRRISNLWGETRETGAQKAAAIAQWKRYLTPARLSKANKAKGKELYAQLCGTCHKMYGEGGAIGPELTGSGRDNLDYLLNNILDPSAVVAKENQLSIVTMKDGRVLSGMIRGTDDRTTGLQTLAEKITLPTPEIAKIETLPNSLMPEGLLDAIGRDDVRDLIGWLMDKNPGATSAAEPAPAEFSIAGDWSIHVKSGDGTATSLEISPPKWNDVSGEKFATLPVYNPKGGGWNNGAKFAGNIAEVCSTRDLVDVSSVVLRPADQPDATPFVRGKDWEIENTWGTFGRLESGAITAETPVAASYRHTYLRIDSVVRMPDGSIRIIEGQGTPAAPTPPALESGAQRLGNIWIPGPIPKLTAAHLFPILETEFPETTAGPGFAEKFPRLMEKIRTGEPIRILAWGDSVTDGSYLPKEDRWQHQFLARLKHRFPQAEIELLSESWPGRTTVSYLNEPPGSAHNFHEKVLALKPDLVISEFVNDASMGPADYEPAYPKILQAFKEIGAYWVILTPHYILPAWMGLTSEREIDADPRPHVAFLKQFAAGNPVLLADASARYGRLWRQGIPFTSLMVNSVNHPNADGMKIFADTLIGLFPEP
jgi:putative membrane-bound dehydrogenase-like protein